MVPAGPGANTNWVTSKRDGPGTRYHVTDLDAAGYRRGGAVDHETAATDVDAACRAGVAAEVTTDLAATRLTFPEYAARWHAARAFSWEVQTRRRIPGNLAHHLNPAFPGPIEAITTTDVLEWIAKRLTGDQLTPRSSMKLYYDLFNTIMNSAEIDRVIVVHPCRAIKIARVFRGLSRVPRWIPTEAQMLRLFDAAPERYHAALWLGAGQGCRLGEVLGLEDTPRCLDFAHAQLHVAQQLGYDNQAYGGFFLKAPKGGSAGTIDFDDHVQHVVTNHLATFGATDVGLVDATTDLARCRTARLLFTDAQGRPFHDRRWSAHWTRWRNAAGWPARHGTGRSTRCATSARPPCWPTASIRSTSRRPAPCQPARHAHHVHPLAPPQRASHQRREQRSPPRKRNPQQHQGKSPDQASSGTQPIPEDHDSPDCGYMIVYGQAPATPGPDGFYRRQG